MNDGSIGARRLMTKAEREEIAEIERRSKARFDAALKRLGTGYAAKHPRLYHD